MSDESSPSSQAAEPKFKPGDVVFHRSLIGVEDPPVWVVTDTARKTERGWHYYARTQTTVKMEQEDFYEFELEKWEQPAASTPG